jgi:hypothetical protein
MNYGWIKTKVCLPREDEDVLVVDRYGVIAIASLKHHNRLQAPWWESYDVTLSCVLEDILYWQPLPRIPQSPTL